ncbi:hypothetical protein GCM10027203_11650 [Nonomuraea fastidiosa]
MAHADARGRVTEFHAPLELREVEIAAPGPGEVRVRVKASGVCGSDLKAIDGKSPVAGRLPFILGHESAGAVESAGEPGDPVIIAMNGPCGRCGPCQAGRFHLCASPGRLPIIMGGLPRVTMDGTEVRRFIGIGSFAEYAVVPEATRWSWTPACCSPPAASWAPRAATPRRTATCPCWPSSTYAAGSTSTA